MRDLSGNILLHVRRQLTELQQGALVVRPLRTTQESLGFGPQTVRYTDQPLHGRTGLSCEDRGGLAERQVAFLANFPARVLIPMTPTWSRFRVQPFINLFPTTQVLGTLQEGQVLPSQVFIDFAELRFISTKGTDDGGNRTASQSLERSQTVKPGNEAAVACDDDRGQEPQLANAPNQDVDVAERTHPFSDPDRVYSDALNIVRLRGARIDPVRWLHGLAHGGSCHAKDSTITHRIWERLREGIGLAEEVGGVQRAASLR
jgi:hypothetical protein